MTVMEQTDIHKQVTWLLDNDEFAFSSVHWQLNAGFWGNDYAKRGFKRWSETSYIPGVERLAQFWVDQMEAESTVLKLYPLLGIANSLLHDEERQSSSLRRRMDKLRHTNRWLHNSVPYHVGNEKLLFRPH